jgi:hypothetical protein
MRKSKYGKNTWYDFGFGAFLPLRDWEHGANREKRMTWVIGRAGPFGYATGISDIQVTLRNRKVLDCLQKIHYIGPNMVLGFAGSVSIGLKFVELMQSLLFTKEDRGAWNPLSVAENFPAIAHKFFYSQPITERENGCELMLISAHPTLTEGNTPWGKCYVHRFRWPNFLPEITKASEIVSIGSGEKAKPYIEEIQRLNHDQSMFQLEVGYEGGAGLGLMESISSVLNKIPVKGISNHIQISIIDKSGVRNGNNDRVYSVNPEDNFIMPIVAKNLEEFKLLLNSNNAGSGKQAIC